MQHRKLPLLDEQHLLYSSRIRDLRLPLKGKRYLRIIVIGEIRKRDSLLQKKNFHSIPIKAAGTGSTKNNITVERGNERMFQATTAATALDAPNDTEIKVRFRAYRKIFRL
jgi:hypothetical protein